MSTRLKEQAESNRLNAVALRDAFRGVYLERWQRRHALRGEAERALDDQQWTVEDLDERIAALTIRAAAREADAERHGERLESIDAALASLRQQRLENPPIAFGTLFETVLMVGLLGWAIGILLNPVNKGLLELSQWLPPRRYKPRRNPALYYIGKNVITQEDYDALLRRYHRFAQITVSLVLPLLALAGVLSKWCKPPWLPLAIALPVALLLLVLGFRRYHVFHQRVRTFICGRLRFLREQRKKEEQKASTVDLTHLAVLVAKAEKLLAHPKSCCCPKCRGPARLRRPRRHPPPQVSTPAPEASAAGRRRPLG